MLLRVRALLASAAIAACFGPLASVHAQEAPQVATPDAATLSAITQWHNATLSIVAPQYHDAVAAMYADQPVDSTIANEAAEAKAQAEGTAMTTLDHSVQVLIRNYYDQAQAEAFGNNGED